MGKIILTVLIVFGSTSFAAENKAQEKTLRDFIYQQLSLRSGVEVNNSLIDAKESSVSVRSENRFDENKEAAIASNQVLSVGGELIIKKDKIEMTSVDGTFVFTNGLACSVGSKIAKSARYKTTSSCKIVAQCVFLKGEKKDLDFQVESDCSGISSKPQTSKEDRDSITDSAPSIAQ